MVPKSQFVVEIREKNWGGGRVLFTQISLLVVIVVSSVKESHFFLSHLIWLFFFLRFKTTWFSSLPSLFSLVSFSKQSVIINGWAGGKPQFQKKKEEKSKHNKTTL